MVEAARHLARQFDVRHLVLAHRHPGGAVHEDVGALQQWIAEETVGGEVAVGELLLLILVARNPLQPAQRRDHRQQRMQLRVLRHARLYEQRRPRRIDACREPVDHHVPDMFFDHRGCVVMCRQRMPVGNEKKTRVFALQPDPVLESAVKMPQVQTPGGAHARDDALLVHGLRLPIVESEKWPGSSAAPRTPPGSGCTPAYW